MKKIKEVIVVEGKDDTKRIQIAVNADTLETNGSAISKSTLHQIGKLQSTRGVIVFTDPDFSGEQIRKKISAAVPGVKHAFLPRAAGVPTNAGDSLGVEHATPAAIRTALGHLYTETVAGPQQITQTMLLHANLLGGPTAKQRRQRLDEILQIGYTNGKQLAKRLQLFQITVTDFQAAVAQLDEEQK